TTRAESDGTAYLALVNQRHEQLCFPTLEYAQNCSAAFFVRGMIGDLRPGHGAVIIGGPDLSEAYAVRDQLFVNTQSGAGSYGQMCDRLLVSIDRDGTFDFEKARNSVDEALRQRGGRVEVAQIETDFFLHGRRVVIWRENSASDNTLQRGQQRVEYNDDENGKKQRYKRIFRVIADPGRNEQSED